MPSPAESYSALSAGGGRAPPDGEGVHFCGYPCRRGSQRPVFRPRAFDATLGGGCLRAVRTAADPDAMLLDFLQSTYESAAGLAAWDRRARAAGTSP